MKTLTSLLVLLFGLMNLPAAELKPIHKLSRPELAARQTNDAAAVLSHRKGLAAVVQYMESRPELFPATKPAESRLLRREEKEAVWAVWQRLLDYTLALDSLESYHDGFHWLPEAAREDSFLIGYAALLAKYRTAQEFIRRVERNPELDKVLNDPVPELGLPGDTYAKYKLKYLNVLVATEFTAHEVLLPTFTGNRQPALRDAIRADAGMVWQAAAAGHGELLTAKNALKVIEDGAHSAWMPVQTGVSEWMGDTRIRRNGEALVSPEQIKQLLPKLQPGDVLLERRNWFLSNIGLPGFWSHAALYVGTAAERRTYFDDPKVRAWVKAQGHPGTDLEALLQARSPKAYSDSGTPQEHGHAVRVLEAMSEGVVFTTLEHSAGCDSLAVLRPRLPRTEKAAALLRAFHYAGRPYDFNFDFSTDAELVCTELVYKAYEPATGYTGLKFPLVEMLGRKVTPANELVKQFAAQLGTPEQQYDLILFLDGQERANKAVPADVGEFCASAKRPKWHTLTQKTEP